VHLAYIWIVSHIAAKNYRNWWKFDEVLTKTNLLSFFWDTVYNDNDRFNRATDFILLLLHLLLLLWDVVSGALCEAF